VEKLMPNNQTSAAKTAQTQMITSINSSMKKPLDSHSANGMDYAWIEQFDPCKSLLRGKAYRFAKRIMDIVVIFFGMPVWLPLMGVCALAIKLESWHDPVFFYQMRTGKGGQRFPMQKFRTMVVNAEELKQQYAHLNELKWPDFKISNDPRITRVGRVLRKTSLDELPQIFNILRGEMSLVGPRPTSFGPETYHLWQTERLDVLPGLTGLWQIVGRASTEFDVRLRMDIAYIEHACLSLDMVILARTVFSTLKHRGAV
jgi:lipopolysaccharide/colanic/teichoic acid biosynthesis glycosyltransferase